jgi:TetR/AcrR family transcriptional regulator, transcriptional repressor of bet genes
MASSANAPVAARDLGRRLDPDLAPRHDRVGPLDIAVSFNIITIMPKKVDLAVQRLTIANAAIDVIDEAGLDGARLRDVARAAKVTTGAVTHYFDGKDAVLEAALAEIVRRTLQRIDARRNSNTPADIGAFIASSFTSLPIDEKSRQEWRVWLAFWGRAIADERLRAIHRDHYGNIIDRLLGPLRALSVAGPKPSRAQLRKCADAFVAAIDGVGTRATLEPELWPPRRQKETLSALLLPMLTAFANGEEHDPEKHALGLRPDGWVPVFP